ncbi:hypothetical protein CC77DRAFT_203017 [Alternaria alternata]|uniref:Uncharacterized protein n=1 Tax=Alternaria alternata TaxID=5599 RepID=A0A177DHE5_ALTAL|nr:hypothetical protein CC77DRAFT_203017 [Alternaria alternata]OAG18620.1 hypothetical protein CC77DRAFT_203017 [Alternaria alternata]
MLAGHTLVTASRRRLFLGICNSDQMVEQEDPWLWLWSRQPCLNLSFVACIHTWYSYTLKLQAIVDPAVPATTSSGGSQAKLC